jgi:predicted Zn finger-like uncharacterized protein
MRLICPSCDATYEIPNRAIPVDGREVQCSACTHAWYQLPVTTVPVPPAPTRPPAHSPAAAQPPAAEGALDPDLDPDDESEAPAPPPPPPRKIDPKVLEVLRAEAQRETRARQRDNASSLETQPDLGLDPPPRKPRATAEGIRERLARLQAAEAAQSTGPNPRRRWQPGEETHVRPTGPSPGMRVVPPPADPARQEPDPVKSAPPKPASPKPAEPPATRALARRDGARLPVPLSPRELMVIEERRQRAGFRLGFGVTAGVGIAALAVFLAAPVLVDRLPASAPVLAPVVAGGEAVQARLASGMRASIAALSGIAAPDG